MADSKHLLSDEQMQHFIVNGYINIKTDLPADFHEAIFQEAEAVFENEGNPGNNLVPRIPEIQEIFDHPTVDGALTTFLRQVLGSQNTIETLPIKKVIFCEFQQ